MTQRKIRVGVVGLGRGMSFARGAEDVGMELVALCDSWEERLRDVASRLGVTAYTDYGTFLEHDMDAVVLANYYHEHAPFAIRALEAGKHVLSETAACMTLAEGVALVRSVEKSGKIYMLAENYPYMVFNQEMRRLYRSGEVGEFRYGEGEYVHPLSAEVWNKISPRVDHWRWWLPVSYYCTHSLAPVMYITETTPTKVNGFVIPPDRSDANRAPTLRVHDTASMIALRMDNGAVVKLLQDDLRGEGTWVRIHGNRGLMENGRFGDRSMLRVRKEPWDKAATEPVERLYLPEFPHGQSQAGRSGHGGGDFFVIYDFADAIRRDEQPYLDVYRGVTMSIVGILAHRSACADSAPLEVPDLRREADRRRFEDDHWSPDPRERRPGQPWPSVGGPLEPTEEALEYARSVWADQESLPYGRFVL